jgi:type I restriction enzyme S subunit
MDYLIYTAESGVVHPKFAFHVLRHPQFLAMLEANKPGGVKGRSQPEFIEMQAIPLPSMEQQEELVRRFDRGFAVCEGASMISENWKIHSSFFAGAEHLLSAIADIGTGSTPSRTNPAYFGGDVNWVLTSEVDENEITATTETLTREAIKDYGLRIYPPDTILVAMYGQGATRGKAALLRVPAAITQNCAGIVIKRPDVLPRYVYYFLRSIYEIIRGQEYSGGGVPHLNLSIIANVRVPIPSPEEQQRVVAELDAKIALLSDLRSLRDEAERDIQQTLNRIWEN